MVEFKTAVTILQELCSQRKIPFPTYTTIADDDLGFLCKIEIMDIEEYGNGRSKRDAKHLAASAALKRLKSDLQVDLPKEVEDDSDFSDKIPMPANVDMIVTLRNYCVQREQPLPKFELVSQYGTPNAPRFTMLCQIASIQRYGTADNKKEAKQKAAFALFMAVKDPLTTINDVVEIVSVNSKVESIEEERCKLFKTYRELVDSGESTEKFGVQLDERHNYFKRFNDNLKSNAFKVLNGDYESTATQAYDVLSALNINPKIRNLPSMLGREMLCIELDCRGLDVCFAGFEETIYKNICDYFRIMLV